MRSVLFLVLLALSISSVLGSCGNETDDTPHPGDFTDPRDYGFNATAPADPSKYYTNILTVVQYNIQSGFNISCLQDIEGQLATINMYKPHFFAIQEVDIDVDVRCNCSQPAIFANGTGQTVHFFRSFDFRTGMYGHAAGSLYPVSAVHTHVFEHYTTEVRGIIALITQPPQFNGRNVILVGNHYQYDNETTRQYQANETIAFVQDLLNQYGDNSLVIMPGDYYTEVGQPAYENLLSYFNNSWNDFNGSPDGGFTYRSDDPKNRFDHVWYKLPAGLPMTVSNVQIPAVEHSDHRPLVVTFSFAGLPAATTTVAATSTSSTTSSSTGSGTSDSGSGASSSGSGSGSGNGGNGDSTSGASSDNSGSPSSTSSASTSAGNSGTNNNGASSGLPAGGSSTSSAAALSFGLFSIAITLLLAIF